jgi:hypothetical protein
MVQETVHVTKQTRHGVSLDRLGCVRRGVAAKVGSYRQVIAAEFSQLGFVEQSAVRMAMKEQHEWAFANPDKEEPRTVAGGVATSRRWLSCRVSQSCANRGGDDGRHPKPGA